MKLETAKILISWPKISLSDFLFVIKILNAKTISKKKKIPDKIRKIFACGNPREILLLKYMRISENKWNKNLKIG